MSVIEPVPVTREERRYMDFKDPTHGLYLSVQLVPAAQRPISAGYSNVYCAHFEGNPEDKVAVKCPLYSSDEEKNKLMDQALEKEITVLKRVRHESILPFLGLVRYGQWNDPGIVTPWMKNGSLRQYLKIQPDADRLEILIDVAVAVGYLHSGAGLPQTSFVIHGDIHAGNVLISDEGKALLADFGLSKRVLVNERTSLSLRPVGGPPGLYLAPELRDVPDAPRSRCSDVFAFGMLMYEAYAGAPLPMPVDRLESSHLPKRTSISRKDMTDAIWKVACACWAHASVDRPSMDNVTKMLRQAAMPEVTPATATTNGTLREYRPSSWTNINRVGPVFQWASAETSLVYGDLQVPSNFVLKEQYKAAPGWRRTSNGAFGAVEIGRRKPSRFRTVLTYILPAAARYKNGFFAIQYLRYYKDTKKNKKLDRALAKETTLLKRSSDHPNILWVLGLWFDPKKTLVTQFADKCSLSAYLETRHSFPVLTKILRDVAKGLEYLHKYLSDGNRVRIAHGDLHPANVFIMTDGAGVKAVLGDFGLCKVVDEHGMTSRSLRDNGVAGHAAYLGPELYRKGDLGCRVAHKEAQSPKYNGHRTVKGDVFAFGMLSFTTLGGDLSLALCDGNAALPPLRIAISIVEGRRPSREHLQLAEDQRMYDGEVDAYWPSIEQCWQGDAAKRPPIEDVRDKIPGAKVRQ